MESVINFKDLVKMIHPDLNPDIEDAGAKMADAVRHRKDPSMLYRLAVRWHLVKGPGGDTSREERNTHRTVSFAGDAQGNVRDIRVGDLVAFHTGKTASSLHMGVIVEHGTVRNGPRKGWNRFMVVDIRDQRLWIFKIFTDVYESGCSLWFREIAEPALSDPAFQTYTNYIERKVARTEQKKAWRKEHNKIKREQAAQMGLKPNRRFNDGTEVRIQTRGWSWFRVTRTTAKRVYFIDQNGSERFANLSSVYNVRKED